MKNAQKVANSKGRAQNGIGPAKRGGHVLELLAARRARPARRDRKQK